MSARLFVDMLLLRMTEVVLRELRVDRMQIAAAGGVV
jgi:hypothetical protein